MTTTPPAAAKPPTKPAWTRCPACKDRLWNDPIDIEVHRQHCPADLERALEKMGKALEKAIRRIDELERRPVPHTVQPEMGPRLDLEHEAPWPADQAPVEEAPTVYLGDDEDEEPAPAPAPPSRPSYFDDEDEEEDLDPASIRTSMH